jgi:hypothetical protein
VYIIQFYLNFIMSKFLCSGKYRRQVLIGKPFKRLSKVYKKRNTQAQMQMDFPSKGQIESLKNAVDAAEIKLRGGSILTDYGTVVKGTKAVAEEGLKTWDTVVTVAKSGNAMGEIMQAAMPLANLSRSGGKVITSAVFVAGWLAHVFGWLLQPASYQVATVFGRVQRKQVQLQRE